MLKHCFIAGYTCRRSIPATPCGGSMRNAPLLTRRCKSMGGPRHVPDRQGAAGRHLTCAGSGERRSPGGHGTGQAIDGKRRGSRGGSGSGHRQRPGLGAGTLIRCLQIPDFLLRLYCIATDDGNLFPGQTTDRQQNNFKQQESQPFQTLSPL